MFKKIKTLFFALVLVVFLVSTVGQKYADNIDSVLNLVFGEKNSSQENQQESLPTQENQQNVNSSIPAGFEGAYQADDSE